MSDSKGKYNVDQERLQMMQASFQAILDQEDLFSNIIDHFPHGIEVFAKDGTTVMVNQAMIRDMNIPDISKDMVVGKYNIFSDPAAEETGYMPVIKEIFQGKLAFYTAKEVPMPIKTIRDYYNTGPGEIEAMYQDITLFPIFNEAGEVTHVVGLFVNTRVYKGKVSIAKGREYIENNWNKEFSLDQAAKAANLSPFHFSRLFKSETGMAPKGYHTKVKIDHLTEKLLDMNLNVKEVFDACGVEYTGYSFGAFKKHVGVTPSEFRARIKK
jgi:AraC-like DNA-binding protein